MSSPSPPTRIQSSPLKPRLDLLPPEILRDILDHFAPFPRTNGQYKARQSILLSLCLVSKQLLSFAQPALFEAIILWSEADVAKVAKRIDLLCYCRWMRWSLTTSDFSRYSKLEMDFKRIFENATNLDGLTYYGSLRPSTVHVAASIENWNMMEDRRSKGHLGSAAILYRCDLNRLVESLAARSVEHLRVAIDVDDFTVLPFSSAETILEEWCQRLTNAQPPYPLKSLYLPFLHSNDNQLSPLASPLLQNAVERLVQTCEMLGLEVVLEEPCHYPEFDSLISPEFVIRSEIRSVANQGN
ncbi:hypothetical protein JCM5353_004585 [Sporobolomyces roseus]